MSLSRSGSMGVGWKEGRPPGLPCIRGSHCCIGLRRACIRSCRRRPLCRWRGCSLSRAIFSHFGPQAGGWRELSPPWGELHFACLLLRHSILQKPVEPLITMTSHRARTLTRDGPSSSAPPRRASSSIPRNVTIAATPCYSASRTRLLPAFFGTTGGDHTYGPVFQPAEPFPGPAYAI